MRQLDGLLFDLSDSGEVRGLEQLLDDLDRRLAGAPVIVELRSGRGTRRIGERSKLRGLAVAAGALVAVLLVTVPILLFSARNWADRDATEATPTTIPSAVTTALPPPATTLPPVSTTAVWEATTTTLPLVPGSLTMAWQRVAGQPSLERGWMQQIAVGGPGLVAVGSTENLEAAAWVSSDASEWTRVILPVPPELRSGESFASDVVVGDEGVVVVGGAGGRPTVWRSVNGVEWEAAAIDADPLSGGSLGQVVRSSQGYVALGTAAVAGRSVPAVWTSTDGSVWERVSNPRFAAGLDGKAYAVASITAARDGYLAVGSIQVISAGYEWVEMRAIAWTSADGLTWTLLPDDAIEEADGSQMNRVFEVDGLFVATGAGFGGSVVWTSTDGAAWNLAGPIYTPDANLPGGIEEVTAAGDGRLVGAGAETTIGTPPAPAWASFWASSDGVVWHRVASIDAFTTRGGMIDAISQPWALVSDVVAWESGYVAVGHVGIYFEDTIDELAGNWCGYPEEWAGSCRTDAAVYVGAFSDE